MAKSLSFEDQVLATATHKVEAAKARRHPTPASEKPREVILAACAAIGEQLREEGFTFHKSGPRLKRVHGDLIFEIGFQSDRNNVAGRRAAVWIHGSASSRSLAQWRRNHPSAWVRREGPHAGLIAGAQIGNLGPSPTWMEWDFADASTRPNQVDDAVETIRRIILPFFGLFEDPERSLDTLVNHRMPWQSAVLEYALSNLGRDVAEAVGRSYLGANPQIRERFDIAFAEIEAKGLPGYRGNLGTDLAALAVAADLDLTDRD